MGQAQISYLTSVAAALEHALLGDDEIADEIEIVLPRDIWLRATAGLSPQQSATLISDPGSFLIGRVRFSIRKATTASVEKLERVDTLMRGMLAALEENPPAASGPGVKGDRYGLRRRHPGVL